MPRLVKVMRVQKAARNERNNSLFQKNKRPHIQYAAKEKTPYDIVLDMKQIRASIDMEKECDYLWGNICNAINTMPRDIA